ncbi:MAG: hypothetical protein Q9213_001455 [Squamulea squamosa]
MFFVTKLVDKYVPHEQLLGFPFDSPAYDPFLANGLRCKDLLDSTIRLSESTDIAYYELVDGEGYLFDGLDLDDEEVAQALYLPSSFLNSAIYYRYDIFKERTLCLLCGNSNHGVKSALRQMFPPLSRRSASPLQILDTIVSEYLAWMEVERQRLDVYVRELEGKTGMGAHVFDPSRRVAAKELNDLLEELHVCEGELAFHERTVQFQVGWIEWLQAQHLFLNLLRFGTREIIDLPPTKRPIEEGVASSLSLCASLSRESFEQVRTLRNRIRIQLSVVANFIAQNDSRTNIAIADASRRIAFETRRDSDAMKTIAALTMVFLPGTFVATLFGMVFFTVDSSSSTKFHVNSLWWIYVAVTLPLTLLTIGVWRGWLHMVRRSRKQDEESVGLKEKSH